MAIRKTWGNSTTSHGDYKWRLFFALGLSTDGAFNRHNHHEALQYNDVIIGNFSDTYRNIIIKTFMSHYWAFSKFSCRYVLKTDDDVYVRVSQLSHWLAKADSPLHFYGGFISYQHPVTRTQDQWYISREEFNESVWPPFAYGAFHVLSTDLLPAYFHYTQFRRKPFHTDDAYMGVVARDLGVKAINIPGLCYTNKVCDLKTATGILPTEILIMVKSVEFLYHLIMVMGAEFLYHLIMVMGAEFLYHLIMVMGAEFLYHLIMVKSVEFLYHLIMVKSAEFLYHLIMVKSAEFLYHLIMVMGAEFLYHLIMVMGAEFLYHLIMVMGAEFLYHLIMVMGAEFLYHLIMVMGAEFLYHLIIVKSAEFLCHLIMVMGAECLYHLIMVMGAEFLYHLIMVMDA
ncbi:hypothetical protein QZH41_002499 [Actinostola sp. cb2023]|nr:hypothetical protein QZH41_002499 [Actinostola sp. cb2023]